MNPSAKKTVRIGVGSYTWPHEVERGQLTASQIIDRAMENGLDCVQLCDNLPWDSLLRLTSSSIPIELGATGLKSLPSWIDLAGKLRSPILRWVIDSADHHPDADEVIAFVRALLPRLEAQGTILAIENHDRFPASVLDKIVTALDSPAVGICLDTANSIGAGEGIAAVLEKLAPHTVCLHLKAVSIHRIPNKMGFRVEGAKPNEGIVDFATTWTAIAAYSRCQSVILEQWPPDPAFEFEWAEAGIAWMKSHFGKE